MDDTLPPIRHTEVGEAKRLHIFLEGGTLRPRVGLRNKIGDSGEVFARGGRDIVVYRRESAVGTANGTPCSTQSLKSLRTRHLVHQMPVDVDEREAVLVYFDDMIVPDLIVKRSRLRNRRWHGCAFGLGD